MATTTFTGAVRSENGFKVINKNSSTGAVTETSSVASTGVFTNKYIKHVGYAPPRVTAPLLLHLYSQQTQSSPTLKSFVMFPQLLEQAILVTKLVHLALAHRLSQR